MNIKRNKPYHVAADHDGIDTDSYDLRIDGTSRATQPVSALANGSIVFTDLAEANIGLHTWAIVAIGPGGEAVMDAFPFDCVAVIPGKPTNPSMGQP